jgi:uncharacterized membrane protein
MKLQNVGRRLLNNLLQGILYVVPIAVTFYVIYSVFTLLDKTFSFIVPPGSAPGLGILAMLVFLIFVGYLGSHFLSTRLVIAFDRMVEKAPLVKVIYFSVRDLLSTFVDKKKNLGKPVIVLMNKEQQLYRPGFITQKRLNDLNLTDDFVAVYFPHSYAFSGELYITHKDNIMEVKPEIKAADVMKFIVSGGVTRLN